MRISYIPALKKNQEPESSFKRDQTIYFFKSKSQMKLDRSEDILHTFVN